MCRYLVPLVFCVLLSGFTIAAEAADKKEQEFPPKIPGGKQVVTDTSKEFLKAPATLKPGVKIAKEAPTVDFMYYDGQDYKANLWSAWGENLAVGDICYSAIGDHTGPKGNAFLYEYDSKTKELKEVVDVVDVIKIKDEGTYTPGKIHSRIDLGKDGWLYFSTHRGSTRVTIPKFNYKGDWILRYNPKTKKSEVVSHGPLPMQCMPTSRLDPERLIFYAGTADGDYKNKKVQFLAYDIQKGKVLYSDDHGPYRSMIFAKSTGKVYFHGDPKFSSPSRTDGPGKLVCFDPENPGTPKAIDAAVGLRAASDETSDGRVYTVDHDNLWVFNTKTEKAKHLGPVAAGVNTYTTSIDMDPKTERYLYYVPGAHGGSQKDGSAVIQYDTKTNTRKVICFLHPLLHKKYGFIPCGAFGTDISPEGDKLYITWNGNRDTPQGETEGRVKFDICAFTVIHIPESERQP